MNLRTQKIIFAVIIFILIINLSVAATRTFYIKENDFIRVRPEAVDLDQDKVTFTYSPPLDEQGEWQTGYDDAGEYEIEITADDGIDQSIEKIKIIVENSNQAPYLKENKLTIKETETANLKDLVADPDNDVLTYQFNAPFDKNGLWQTNYEDAGTFVTEFIVNDGEYEKNMRAEVEILPSNQPPIITETFYTEKNIQLDENERLDFWVKAFDKDDDPTTYQWTIDGETIGVASSGEYAFDFDSAGDHFLKVSVSDGNKESNEEWTISVDNVNRAPEFKLLPIVVNEEEKVSLDLLQFDADGDVIDYTFESPLNNQGEWQTNYDDAGKYTLTVTGTDGDLTTTEDTTITVLDVDRAPLLDVPDQIEVNENEELSFFIKTSDPDGDNVKVSVDGLPEEANYNPNNGEVSWKVSYDYIHRNGGIISNFLNFLRLEHFLLKKQDLPITISACGKEVCTFKETNIVIYNINRAPEFTENLADVNIKVNEKVIIVPHAEDADGDIVNYAFTEPLGKRTGEWKPGYEDAGEYTAYVSASDGKLVRTIPLNINVQAENRAPTIKIKDDNLVVNEGQEFSFSVSAADPDGDEINLRLDNLPPGASFNEGLFVWKAPFNSVTNASRNWWNNLVSANSYLNKKFNHNKAELWLSFVTSDGEFETVHPVKVTIKDVNQAPQLLDYLPAEEISAKLGEKVIFHVAVKDADNDPLQYEWGFGLNQDKAYGTDTIERTFTKPGEKTIKVVVSDGLKEVVKEWKVNVLNEVITGTTAQPTIPQIPFTIGVYVIER